MEDEDNQDEFQPDADGIDYRKRLISQLKANQDSSDQDSERLSGVSNDISHEQRQNALAAALAKGAAQVGSLGGKTADASPVSAMGEQLNQASGGQYQDMLRSAGRSEKRRDMDTKVAEYLASQQDKSEQAATGKAARDANLAETTRHNKAMESRTGVTDRERPYEYMDADGNKRVGRYIVGKGLVTSDDDAISARPDKAPGKQTDTAFYALSKPDQETVTKLTESSANKIAIANQIDSDLDKLKEAFKNGNEDLAVTHGENMLKVLNSTEGKDAVGAEEAKRLASFLEYKIANFREPGSFIGRDLDQFVKQAADKSNSIKNAVQMNRKQIADIYGGRGGAPMAQTDGNLPPKGRGGGVIPTATAAPGGNNMPSLDDIEAEKARRAAAKPSATASGTGTGN